MEAVVPSKKDVKIREVAIARVRLSLECFSSPVIHIAVGGFRVEMATQRTKKAENVRCQAVDQGLE